MSVFWGLRLEAGKRYSTTVDKSFHVSMAALDITSVKSDNDILTVMLEEGESEQPYILCNLNRVKAMQCSLDLNFMTGDRITFFFKGNTGKVHLSGYVVPDDDDFSDQVGDEDDDEELEEECEEEENIEMDTSKESISKKGKVNGIGTEKRKLDMSQEKKKKNKKKKVEPEEEESEEVDEEDDEDKEISLDEMGEDSDSMGEGEGDSEESEEEEDEDESGDEEAAPVILTPQSQQKDKKKQQPTPNQKQTPGKGNKTPNVKGLPPTSAGQQSGKKDKKKGQGATPGATPKGPGDKAGGDAQGTPQKKALEGGVTVKDVKIGNGPVCKPGKMATVYYVGRLKSNDKVFDSTQQGPGFKFRVGRGEVIKGWDVGLQGMKVGGKRLITCPPHMAYGQRGSPPTIPSNSTLVFEVELKGLN